MAFETTEEFFQLAQFCSVPQPCCLCFCPFGDGLWRAEPMLPGGFPASFLTLSRLRSSRCTPMHPAARVFAGSWVAYSRGAALFALSSFGATSWCRRWISPRVAVQQAPAIYWLLVGPLQLAPPSSSSRLDGESRQRRFEYYCGLYRCGDASVRAGLSLTRPREQLICRKAT